MNDVLRDGNVRAGDPEPSGDLVRSEAIGDRNDDTTDPDDPEVRGNGFHRHGHGDGDAVPGADAQAEQTVRDPHHQGAQLPGRHPLDAALTRKHDCGPIEVPGEAAGCDVEPGTGQPAGMLHPGAQVEHACGRSRQDDAEARDGVFPERSALGHRPLMKSLVGLDAPIHHRRRQVCPGPRGVVRMPERRRSLPRFGAHASTSLAVSRG